MDTSTAASLSVMTSLRCEGFNDLSDRYQVEFGLLSRITKYIKSGDGDELAGELKLVTCIAYMARVVNE